MVLDQIRTVDQERLVRRLGKTLIIRARKGIGRLAKDVCPLIRRRNRQPFFPEPIQPLNREPSFISDSHSP